MLPRDPVGATRRLGCAIARRPSRAVVPRTQGIIVACAFPPDPGRGVLAGRRRARLWPRRARSRPRRRPPPPPAPSCSRSARRPSPDEPNFLTGAAARPLGRARAAPRLLARGQRRARRRVDGPRGRARTIPTSGTSPTSATWRCARRCASPAARAAGTRSACGSASSCRRPASATAWGRTRCGRRRRCWCRSAVGGATVHLNAGVAIHDEPLRAHEQRDFFAYGVALTWPLGPVTLVARGGRPRRPRIAGRGRAQRGAGRGAARRGAPARRRARCGAGWPGRRRVGDHRRPVLRCASPPSGPELARVALPAPLPAAPCRCRGRSARGRARRPGEVDDPVLAGDAVVDGHDHAAAGATAGSRGRGCRRPTGGGRR